MSRRARLFTAALFALPSLSVSGAALAQNAKITPSDLSAAAAEAEQQLHQTFTNLQFDDFGPAPIAGPIYQANAGGRIIYFAPQSQHLIFAAVYDKNGINLTALAQEQTAQRKLKVINPEKALAIGPANAPTVIEFTDPDCPYCQALERFWAAKAAEGKPVRRLVFFVSGIHPMAAAKAEHILCSPDPAAAFKATYAGQTPAVLRQCQEGHSKVAEDAKLVSSVGITGTPTLIVDGKLVSGFQQAELEAFLDRHAQPKAAGGISQR
jgi:thiol:disulfide interchange protein DsbC